MCDMLWFDKIQQLVEKGILAANHRCQAHSLVQFVLVFCGEDLTSAIGLCWPDRPYQDFGSQSTLGTNRV